MIGPRRVLTQLLYGRPRILSPRISVSPLLTSMLAASVLTSAMARGADYIAIDENRPQSLSFVESAMPLDWWGYLLLGAALFAAASWVGGRWGAALIGHVTLSITYVMFGVGSLVAVFGESWTGSGWRSGVGYIIGAGVTHFILALTTLKEWDRARARRQMRADREEADE